MNSPLVVRVFLRRFATLLLAASVTTALPAAEAGGLLACLKPLKEPTLDNAVKTVVELGRLGNTQQGEQQQLTWRVSQVVRSLFSAEHQLKHAVAELGPAKEREQKKIEAAKLWLVPNAFGHTSTPNYNNTIKEAEAIKQAAKQRVKAERGNLGRAMDDALAAVKKLNDDKRRAVANRLKETVDAVAARSLKIAEPRKLSPDQLDKQLLALGLVGVFLVVAATHDTPAGSDGFQNKLDGQLNDQFKNQNIQTHNNERENLWAQNAGRPLPHPGYGCAP